MSSNRPSLTWPRRRRGGLWRLRTADTGVATEEDDTTEPWHSSCDMLVLVTSFMVGTLTNLLDLDNFLSATHPRLRDNRKKHTGLSPS